MNKVKLQCDTEKNQFYHLKSVQSSAFSFIKKQYANEIESSNDMQAYINKRKNQNSFTLSDILLSSSQFNQQNNQDVQDNQHQKNKKMSIMQSNQCIKKAKQLAIQYKVFDQTIFATFENKIKNQSKSFQINSNEVNMTILPEKKLYIFKDQESNQSTFQSKGSKIRLPSIHSQNTEEDLIKDQQLSQQYRQNKSIQGKFPNPSKFQTIKAKQNRINQLKIQAKFEQNTNSKKRKQRRSFKNQNFVEQIRFDGVLRNCKCCGKLISKLCFKCPHIYCNQQNCPRKRKKILNQRMLQKMKQQRIQQHYRQREKYERMKTQKGQNFNPNKLIGDSTKVKVSEKKQVKNEKKIKKLKNQSSISYDQCLDSEDEIDQLSFFDSGEIQQKGFMEIQNKFNSKKKMKIQSQSQEVSAIKSQNQGEQNIVSNDKNESIKQKKLKNQNTISTKQNSKRPKNTKKYTNLFFDQSDER